MKRHLPKGRWTQDRLQGMPWRELSAIARYPYHRSKAAAKRRIHKIERRQTVRELNNDPDNAAVDLRQRTPDE